ncbi:MAG: four helix bundle protein [Desulfuromonadaceae bacterium]|nr:four helix bundle protein [Desulfuromonadaceae bacterium]
MEKFKFEELEIWQRAVEFADLVIETAESLETPRNHFRLIEQLEAAATSVAMNIAEGKGRYSKKEFVHYLYIARGSLFETVTLLKIIHKRRWISDEQVAELNQFAIALAKMLNAFINALKKSQS